MKTWSCWRQVNMVWYPQKASRWVAETIEQHSDEESNHAIRETNYKEFSLIWSSLPCYSQEVHHLDPEASWSFPCFRSKLQHEGEWIRTNSYSQPMIVWLSMKQWIQSLTSFLTVILSRLLMILLAARQSSLLASLWSLVLAESLSPVRRVDSSWLSRWWTCIPPHLTWVLIWDIVSTTLKY